VLLHKLKEYAETGRVENLAPTGYKETPIRYLVNLDENGHFLGCVDQAQSGNSREKRGKRTIAPHVGRAYAIRPKLLADNGEYVLGIARDPVKQSRVDESHRAFVDLMRFCSAETGEPTVSAVLAFLDGGADTYGRLPSDFDPGAVVTFKVGDLWPIDLPSVQSFWARHSSSQEGDSEQEKQLEQIASAETGLQCLVCGRVRPGVKRLAYKWQGIPGGQTSGLALISANAPAFESYGLEASLVAPTCAECGELFSKAANALLSGDRTRVRVGSTAYIFWTREEIGFNFGSLITDPTTEQLKALYAAPYSGQRQDSRLDDMPFYAAALSASGARVVVRDWLDTTIGVTKRNLLHYFNLQELVDRNGLESPPLGIRSLAGATVRDPMKDPAPLQVTRSLLHLAVNGGIVPRTLLYEAVRRCGAAGEVTRPQAALIKMVLLSEREQQGGGTGMVDQELVRLDERNREPAYLCGRLLAVLEAIQRAALGDINATIVDRYFGTASSAPASVFSRLVKGAQPHLGKLRRDPRKKGAYVALQERLMDIMNEADGLQSFPPTLNLPRQGLFILGYYHQRSADRAAARANKALTTLVTNPEDEGAGS